MILNIDVKPETVKKTMTYNVDTGVAKFPILTIDKDSYIAGAKIESGINFHWEQGTYNLHIGKYCSLAKDILFMIDTNHSYDRLYTGVVLELKNKQGTYKSTMRPRGEIIIQNDCWIGHGATIMDGVTIHNGAVVGTNAVVTKDVPPYAIVAGNPARIVKYRFDEDTINKLQKIAWWDWDSDKILQYADKMVGNVKEFVDTFYVEDMHKKSIELKKISQGKSFVFYLDIDEPYCIWKKVIKQFAEAMNNTDNELILYLNPNEYQFEKKLKMLYEELALYEDYNCYVNICTEVFEDDADLLQIADYYISNRYRKNVHRMCKADLHGAKHLIGVSSNIFYNC